MFPRGHSRSPLFRGENIQTVRTVGFRRLWFSCVGVFILLKVRPRALLPPLGARRNEIVFGQGSHPGTRCRDGASTGAVLCSHRVSPDSFSCYEARRLDFGAARPTPTPLTARPW